MKFEETLTFNDVLIKPSYSEIRSRSEIDLSINLSKGLNFTVPVFPANMKTIINLEVAEEFYKLGGMCLLHRFCSIDEQINILQTLQNKYEDIFDYVGVSVGVKEEDYKNVKTFYDLGVRIICIDVAHGDSKNCVFMTSFIHENFHDVFLIAGNVATSDGAFRLWLAGADAVKIGVGSGSICLTRTTTGVGVPQLSALIDVYETRAKNPILKDKFIISDGGCSKVGDIVKALCFSDMIMLGNMFAGALETPGTVIKLDDGRQYKHYDGSSTHKSDYIEGVKAMVPAKNKIKEIVKNMLEGISSGCSYVGAKTLQELKTNAQFIKITNAGIIESHAHDVVVK
jgi:IMP dehydrogenase